MNFKILSRKKYKNVLLERKFKSAIETVIYFLNNVYNSELPGSRLTEIQNFGFLDAVFRKSEILLSASKDVSRKRKVNGEDPLFRIVAEST